jgi:alkylation response protein AidB-like acyl-CoA dehydrogenase
MDFNDTPDEAAFRAEARAFLSANAQPKAGSRPVLRQSGIDTEAVVRCKAWQAKKADAGFAGLTWPKRFGGREASPILQVIYNQEEEDFVVPRGLYEIGLGMCIPTMMAYAKPEQLDRYVRPALRGEEVWCQLFSEPAAGSDLAALRTRAERDGDEWVINGQKVWNTSAHHADFGMLLARTDAAAPKHQGLSYFALPMHQPGVQVRPLRQMNGRASFNEVFVTNARVPRENVIGEVGGGWAVALTTLAHERRFGAMRPPSYDQRRSRALDEARAEATAHFAVYAWYPQRAGRVDLVIEHARMAGVHRDPLIRQAIARLITMQRVSQWTAERARAARASGRQPGAEGSIGKLAASNIAREAARVHAMIAAADGLLTGPSSRYDGVIAEVLVSVPAQSIAGGTDEIQKNILAERMLGLPAEPRQDKDVPFNRTRRG